CATRARSARTRTTALSSPEPRFVAREKLLTCVHCGLCLAACPTYVELGVEADSPRGRIHLMRALEEGALAPTPEVIRHLDLCLGCRACETACPSGVEYGALIEAARPYIERFRPVPGRWGRGALAAVLTTPALRRAAFAPLRAVGGARWFGRLARRFRSPWLAYAAALPGAARAPRLPEVLEPEGRPRGMAVLLAGCVAETAFAATNLATAQLLRRAGVRVLVPRGQGCCGALAIHLGAVERARMLARHVASVLGASGADWVVSNAAGCGALLREYGELLPGEPAWWPRPTRAASCRSGRERSCADSTCASSIRSTCSRRRTYHEVVALIRTGDLPQLAGCKLRRAVDRSGSVLAPRNQLFRVDG